MSGLELSSFVHLGWKKESGQRPAFYFYGVLENLPQRSIFKFHLDNILGHTLTHSRISFAKQISKNKRNGTN